MIWGVIMIALLIDWTIAVRLWILTFMSVKYREPVFFVGFIVAVVITLLLAGLTRFMWLTWTATL